MTSIVKDRPIDVILESTNRLNEAKLSGALKEEEFSKIIILVGDLIANQIKKGKVSQEQIDQVESYVSCFVGEYKNNYFSFPHKDLDRAAKTFLEGIYVALEDVKSRNDQARPIYNSNYSDVLKKVK